jgi:D-tyrosyl-tRNA(Tyr) deacylase
LADLQSVGEYGKNLLRVLGSGWSSRLRALLWILGVLDGDALAACMETGVCAVIALLQRVAQARVEVGSSTVGAIGKGLMVLVCAERGDNEEDADRLLERLLNCRVFSDADGKMNLSLRDVRGGLLLVPQFTLAADTRKGNRPSFAAAAPPQAGERLFDYVLARARQLHSPIESGRFGADMQVTLTNDGPVTIWLRVEPSAE